MEAWKEELYHHGIKGQKWGIRNGPPYPLDENQYSGKKKETVKTINYYAKLAADKIVSDKALSEYANKKFGIDTTDEFYHPSDVEETLNFYKKNEPEEYSKAIKELNKIEEDIRKSPEFQSILDKAYDQAFEMEEENRINSGMYRAQEILALFGLTSVIGLTIFSVRDKIKNR